MATISPATRATPKKLAVMLTMSRQCISHFSGPLRLSRQSLICISSVRTRLQIPQNLGLDDAPDGISGRRTVDKFRQRFNSSAVSRCPGRSRLLTRFHEGLSKIIWLIARGSCAEKQPAEHDLSTSIRHMRRCGGTASRCRCLR